MLTELEPYMFSFNKMNEIEKNRNNNTQLNTKNAIITKTKLHSMVNEKKEHVSSEIFTPRQRDSLFWCFYIGTYYFNLFF